MVKESYKKAVITFLSRNPNTWKGVYKELCIARKKMSKVTLGEAIKELEEEGKIVLHAVQIEGERRVRSVYALPGEEHLIQGELMKLIKIHKPRDEKLVRDAILKLRRKLLREPEVEEVAIEARRHPAAITSIVYSVASSLDPPWSPPSPEEYLRSRRKLASLTALAAMIRFDPSKNWERAYAIKGYGITREDSIKYAKEFPKMIPKVKREENEYVLEWSAEARKIIGFSPIKIEKYTWEHFYSYPPSLALEDEYSQFLNV